MEMPFDFSCCGVGSIPTVVWTFVISLALMLI